LAARCSNTGAARLPERSRSRDSNLFLWHQTAFVTVSSVGLLAGRVPGLLTAPTSGLWVAERLAWLPVFAIMLSGLWLAFRRVETPS